MDTKDSRNAKKIILEYFEFIENEWDKFQDEVRK